MNIITYPKEYINRYVTELHLSIK